MTNTKKTMNNLKPAHEFLIAAALFLLLIATRFHHFGSALHLPDASWAIYLAGGFYLARFSYLAVFLITAGVIDYFAITQFGTSNYCISPGYAFLAPAYASLWLGGRWFRKQYQFNWSTLLPLAGATIVSVAVCFLISNGAFYATSDKFTEMSLIEYSNSVKQYFLPFLKTASGYVAFFAIVHSIFAVVTSNQSETNSTTR